MHDFWVSCWTAVWFIGLTVFSVLSVLVIFFGGHDLTAMLKSLYERHQAQQAAEEAAARGEFPDAGLPPPPLSS
ncbi:MAG: hypothetical protein FJX74_04485 [Armatimonadetes bacterium]|nr:hypothetical protein [Armatimonadota bacterium]